MTAYPCLVYRDARAAADFLQRAFGFETTDIHETPEGGVAHCEMRAGTGLIMFGDLRPDTPWGDHTGGGWTYVVVPEVDALCEQARAAGADIVMEPTDQPYGSRDFAARDPEGNLWNFGTYDPAAKEGSDP